MHAPFSTGGKENMHLVAHALSLRTTYTYYAYYEDVLTNQLLQYVPHAVLLSPFCTVEVQRKEKRRICWCDRSWKFYRG